MSMSTRICRVFFIASMEFEIGATGFFILSVVLWTGRVWAMSVIFSPRVGICDGRSSNVIIFPFVVTAAKLNHRLSFFRDSDNNSSTNDKHKDNNFVDIYREFLSP